MTRISFGRHVLGLAAIGFGIISLVWHDLGGPWQQTQAFGHIPHREIFVYAAAALEILGGLAIQWRRTARTGALLLAIIYFVFALLWVPRIIATPRVYDGYGNFFEQFSIVSGALIVHASFCRASKQSANLARMAYIFFSICVISFMLVHIFNLPAVAAFTPKWIPPGPTFWSITTTIAFALAAISLLSGVWALLAARLLTAMIMGFQLLVWLPRSFSDPHQLFNWAGDAQGLAIGGAAWIVADYLARRRGGSMAAVEGPRVREEMLAS